MEYFNNKPRLKTLSTANREGKVDVAYFGSAQMTDEKTVVIGFGAQPIFRQSSREPLCFKVSFRRKPESSNSSIFWMPDQVRQDEFESFCETSKVWQ